MTKEEWDEKFDEKFVEFAADGSEWGAGLRITHTGTTEDREILDNIKSFIRDLIKKDRKHQKSETLKRLPEEIYEKLKKEIKDIQNPYPEYLFTQMTDKEWLKINKLLKKEMGFPLDKVSGNLMRNGFEVGRNTIHKLVNNKLK